MLSLALVSAGTFDGKRFVPPDDQDTFYIELAPISKQFQVEALAVNGLDRDALLKNGADPATAMKSANDWIFQRCGLGTPVLVAYPLSFDWSWIYWYFVRYLGASPFNHSRCFDIKTAIAVKFGIPIAGAGRAGLPSHLRSERAHTHHAVDDAIGQAEIFAKLFEQKG